MIKVLQTKKMAFFHVNNYILGSDYCVSEMTLSLF